jgi:hypothetical protein
VGTGDPMSDSYPHGYEYGGNPYPPVYMVDPLELFLCRGYEYGVVIPDRYLPIAISSEDLCMQRHVHNRIHECIIVM